MGRLDGDGRLSNRSTIDALGWTAGDYLSIALVGGSVVAHCDPAGAFVHPFAAPGHDDHHLPRLTDHSEQQSDRHGGRCAMTTQFTPSTTGTLDTQTSGPAAERRVPAAARMLLQRMNVDPA
jgi:hypothetical protein